MKQVKAGRAIIEARLDEEHRNIPFDEGRLKAMQVKKAHKRETKRRSGKKNNYRKPPVSKQKSPVLELDESLSDESPQSSDENEPGVPNVRVLRRVIISSEDQEEEEEEEQIDELEDDEMDEIYEDMDVDEDEDDNMDC